MDVPDFLPLGSVCSVRGNGKRLMVIARGVAVSEEAGQRYYDYGSCLYPEGIIGDQAMYFNHDTISEVFWRGFADEEESAFSELLSGGVGALRMEKGDPKPVGTISDAEVRGNDGNSEGA